MEKRNKALLNTLGKSSYPPCTEDPKPGTSTETAERTCRKYPPIKQRGFYSDILAPNAATLLEDLNTGPKVQINLLRQADQEKCTPKAETFQIPESIQSYLDAQYFGQTTEVLQKTDFPLQAYEPKVQLPFVVASGNCPRKVEIERRKRHYLSQNINQLLADEGIDSNLLIPRHPDMENLPTIEKNKGAPLPVYLPLEVFDDEEFDCRIPEEWMRLGYEPGSCDRKPLPANALLPVDDILGHEDPKSRDLTYKWCSVGVLDYDQQKKIYLVHKADVHGHVRDTEGNQILNGGITAAGKPELMPCQYWVPRIRLLFCAEDPYVFASRVVAANQLRKKTEALLLYNLYLDCMPVNGLLTLEQESLSKMKYWALTTPRMKQEDQILNYINRLEKEVGLDYERTMNKLNFDRIVSSKPHVFTYVTLPDKLEESVPAKGCVTVPDYPFVENRATFIFNTLLTRPEVITSLCKVRAECNRVASMSLFHSTLTKCVRIEEFEQTQSQTFSQVQLFLKDSWIITLKNAIRASFREVGKGWYNLHETNWKVYSMSKLHQLMELIKFNLQDSLRFLVQDSLVNFTQFILDACCSVLECAEDMDWGGDLVNSPYKPRKNPIFLLDLVLDIAGVHFNVPLENFEASLMMLFDKGIMATNSVPQLEKFVLEDMFISSTPLLETVGLYEPPVEELRNSIRSAIRKAIIPLRAYTKQYERNLELNNIDLESYMKPFRSQTISAQEIKVVVNMHLLEKERLDNTLPSTIVIGPFLVMIEGVKQNLLRKRRTLANALLELLAKNLRRQVEEISEQFRGISRKLYEKPNSVEELTELREWMKGIPDQVKILEDQISKIIVDYDVIDEFFYNLTNDDFDTKWYAIGWPHKILTQMEMIQEQHLEDEERFHKIQIMDQNNFMERLDSLQMALAGLPAYMDIGRAHEIANEVRRLQKQLKESQQMALLYNNRERLFGMPITNYDVLLKIMKEFQPFRDLWTTVSDWLRWHDSWMNDPITLIDAEQIEKNVSESYKIMHKCVKQFRDFPACQNVAQVIKDKIEDFKPYIPLIQGLRNPGMRDRHWQMLSDQIHIKVKPKANLTFSRCLEMKLQDHIESIAKVAEVAGKEYSIEQALDKMENEWMSVMFNVLPYKETGTFILKSPDEASQLLDDHIVMTQSMSFSPYKKPFEQRISTWEGKLQMTQDVLEEWLTCQRSWLYLEPIFSSEDINRQLPVESKRYQTMERIWRKIMKNAEENKQVISLCPDPRLLENLRECNKLLEMVQKGLSEYLETKRGAFPRFYFLSDDELLEILSQTKDPTAVQPHLRKCFENIARLLFQEDLQITHMYSGEGEEVMLSSAIYPTGNVEDWLLEVERVMKATIREYIRRSIVAYPVTRRTEWVLNWPGQVTIAGCQTFWTQEVSYALEAGNLSSHLFPKLSYQLSNLVALVRGKLSRMQRTVLSALIVIEVHAKDVAAKLIEEEVKSINDFEWISQLRYYWTRDDLYIQAVNAEFIYGYEYLGNSGRLVITPLTDRCYLTLTGALHLKFGGAPAGPAGTGKTETTKDLGKALAIQTVVFNCSDQLDFMAMGKFLKGLASSGAWACFDEFNRIDIEVLSVVAQQITTIQKAQQQRVNRFMFEGVEIPLVASCAVFITMNPGYAGRTELPDNLKALFRPVAMMVPDYAMIAEISLYSFGFNNAKVLAKKITTTFKLSSEQLSSQDHYDFGMRAVKTVISAAGNLKRENPEMNEELICLRAIRDVNVPKFLQGDLKLFNGIVSDLFPKIKEEAIDYGILEESIRSTCIKKNLKDVDGFITKCIQLYETTIVRHGLMLVGPTGSGKTKCYKILAGALTALKGKPSVSGGTYEAVNFYILNPKSITMGQLYGEFDLLTHEWTDGILSSLIRAGAVATEPDKKWYMFDGPVDAVWIENMNTVLDDNKKLCLSSGEIIKLSEAMTMMFEVQDLAVASPATVSRCGMVYLEPSILGLVPFTECWLKQIPAIMKPFTQQLESFFTQFLQVSINFVRTTVKEVIPSTDNNLVMSLLKLLDCFFMPFIPKEGERQISVEKQSRLGELIEPWFIFSLIWSIGVTGDADSRIVFSKWLRTKMEMEQIKLMFPQEGLVYDYRLADAGISSRDDEEEEAYKKVQWIKWIDSASQFTIDADTSYSDIIVPTLDTVRMSHLLGMLLTNKKPVLCIGPTGTGKTLTISDKLLKNLPMEYISHFLMFSARTSANQTQDLIDSKLDKRRKGVFGPPLGRYFIIFIDDLNMPALETYGAQPPIELLRQWMDHCGWYDRKQIGTFKQLVDINLICAMGPPGGGRNPVSQRLARHFNYLSFTEMEDSSKIKIFSTILGSWLASDLESLNEPLVNATIKVYSTITSQLLPTPAKSHYTFNLRDLSKVFQGILMAEPSQTKDKLFLLRLWYHESCRVFQDRLVNEEDRTWFDELMKEIMQEFDSSFTEVIPNQPVLYGDFMSPGSDSNIYQLIEDHVKLVRVIEEYMEDYNQINTTKMKLVLFMDAVQHICRISRILRQPLGNALLLGVGGSGRQSLTKLATHIAEYECFQIELSKNYGTSEWREDIKRILLKAGLQNISITFLFVDTQIKSESFLEDINNVLNSGDVPNLYGLDEQDEILTVMKPIVQDLGQQPTKANLMAAYTKRVRSNIHTVLCMSPIGEVFRARLRQFPSLVTCCTIDWFNEWPAEALRSVASSFLQEMPELEATQEVIDGMIQMCVEVHQSVALMSKQYLAELSRHNYITPKSYLELLSLFSKLIGQKKQDLKTAKIRMKSGLDKLLRTAEDVAKMQGELELMRPLLEEAAKDTVITMDKIKVDTAVAEETRASVQVEETKASEKADIAQAIADDAQKDLDEALPALDAALASLKSLNKNDVTEVRAMQRPPVGVKLVIEAVCIIKGIKPKKVPGEKPGTKIDDYWEPGKGLLQDPGKFLESLFKFDKDNIPDVAIKAIQPYIDNEEFQPAAIARVSKACTSICQWVRAMHKYHFVAKGVEPKRQALREAQEDLDITQKILDTAKARLNDVEIGIALLEAKYKACVAKKEELEQKCDQCEQKLKRADKLITGLADEKVRWEETVQNLEFMVDNIAGDVMLSAGFVAYLGPFTGYYRVSLCEEWIQKMKKNGVPCTKEPSLFGTLGDPVKIRSWQIAGLPNDTLSVENGMITQYSQRWSHFIDPQGQANKWIKNMEKDHGLEVMKLSDRDFLRSLENAIRFGKPCMLENVGEELDPALEPVLLKQTFKQQGNIVLRLGDTVIPYHSDFKMYITTNLPNPHYTPEISTKVTLINFTLSPSGLEDQLLGQVVAEERPDLEEAKNQLIISNAKMRQELKEIEDQILYRLSSSEGNPVDDEELIKVLEASKIKAGEIKAKVIVAEQTEKDIDITRSQYVPVAVRTQILFFCVSDLSNVDPMYQYSLEWFLNIFLAGIANSAMADSVEKRIENINMYFTFSLYCNVCRSLFEKHKLMFAFLLCVRIMMNLGKIDMDEWRYLLSGGTIHTMRDNPASEWLSERAWRDILALTCLENFSSFADDFEQDLLAFRNIFDSSEPHREPLPGEWDVELDAFQKLLVLRCLRGDKVTNAMQDFVAANLGQRFIEPQTSDLAVVFKDSTPTTPLIFVLSPGTDPAADLYKFAESMRFSKKLSAISLGQGQGPRAEAMMRSAMERGKWVFFQNCHLSPSWMPSLERLIESIDPEKVHRDFRLWLTSLPSNKFPVAILQNSSKMTIEPPRGVKANLLKSYMNISEDFLNSCSKASEFKALLLSLCLFHGNSLERRKFGPLGFNIPYEFTDGDLRICISQLKMFLDEYAEIPYKVLKYTAGEINYGGRVTDDWDRRCIMNILEDFYHPKVLKEDHIYSESGIYRQISTAYDLNGYLEYIKSLPINDIPEIFGLHDNANITFAQNEIFNLFNAIIDLQPKSSSSGGKGREEIVEEVAGLILKELPEPINVKEVMSKYPVLYEESMNTVLVQEVIRYNRLLEVIAQTVQDLMKAIKGLVVMSSELELMSNSLYNNAVPELWKSKAYPSLKPLASWVMDLLQRIEFVEKWIMKGIPPVFWISGFFFPQAFLTGTLQNFARKSVISIDIISFNFKVMSQSVAELKERPPEGCFIHGLYLEGARWDPTTSLLSESRPKELYTEMAVIWLIPVPNRKMPVMGFYLCPIYKTLTRAGTLSTTGHSTNYVIAVEIPSTQPQKHWIKRGVALICALDY
uniref:Dynein axonemal heavy chain 1 n=2 Tax=Geotrypetes seraphini TaxID=260995 RepID=A0A6P8PLP3_GEOSA|nr:dynein heavy chain 1, axonemal isoform X1 [Geotrypetes seraphini]XP_033782544.1 dynein heavy chain 1, axonemal isoform X1 [Geotrypetes seraphini]XP_033782545.1 dynein heavy chain 1, axonemal isoform X1 [Geotrypetes seraphini]XP_033782546.1 dynein heavy chain 1, axonemal isoform X1 [Geotrypetes seraphini]XP_033782547.1 dynein heavy chain 1, axonemal isoform X1 [Geotrypetes seraphini]